MLPGFSGVAAEATVQLLAPVISMLTNAAALCRPITGVLMMRARWSRGGQICRLCA